jgi:hypothetical protein
LIETVKNLILSCQQVFYFINKIVFVFLICELSLNDEDHTLQIAIFNGTAHFAQLKLDPLEVSSEKVHKTKYLLDKIKENSNYIQGPML